jgi:branched-chain amino acid transport system ATP-binding protein
VAALLEVVDLWAGYGQSTVLRGVSLEVAEGEAVALMGPNGHGKTTLLKVISGVHRASSGRIAFAGSALGRATPNQIVKHGVIHMPQGNPLFPDCTVEENLALGAYSRRARSGSRQRFDKVYDVFPILRERRRQRCRTLSGGERQMLAVGMGLMADPRVLILDEPTLGLAPKIRKELAARVRQIREDGVTLLVVDGDLEFASTVGDRWCLMEMGRITAEGAFSTELAARDMMAMYFGGKK